MESSKFHQQHQDHQPVLDSSCYGLSWSQNPIFANTELNTMNNVASNPNEQFMTRELQRLAKMEDEFSSSESHQKFSEMISSSPTSSIEDMHFNPSHGYNNNQEMLLTTFSNGCQIKANHLIDQFQDQDSSNNHYQYGSSRTALARGTFSQILPTINISNLNQSPAAVSSNSFDMNLPALDLFGSPRFSSQFSHPSSFQIPYQVGSFFKDTCLSYGLDQMHQPNHRPVISQSKLASSLNTRTSSCADTKRPATSYMDTKAPQAAVQKKSKLEPRSSCAPFKVRKEKLGDRIAALQQLVAPFGKTDTASVLMEAIGYINFLQNQVETLSLPYMKPTHKNNMLPTRGVTVASENEEGKQDLRSRGLCLVPLSCLSYVTDSSGNVWPAP